MRQGPNESMYDYVEKFNRLERSCCNLGLPEKLLNEYLLDGFKPLDKMLLDASAGGTMSSLPLSEIRELISRVAENARFREETSRYEEFTRTKNVVKAETPLNSMANEMKQMKEMMMQIIRRQPVVVKPCEYCGAMDHKTDECLTLLEEDPAEGKCSGWIPRTQWQPGKGRVGRMDKGRPDRIGETTPQGTQLISLNRQLFNRTSSSIGLLTANTNRTAQANISKGDRVTVKPVQANRTQASHLRI
ncbi:unnamed protein product [Rhodiola kirilowii]